MNMSGKKRAGFVNPVIMLFTIVVIVMIIGMISLFITGNPNAQATVISSKTYDAGTIIDGVQSTILGYNMTFAYHGVTSSTTVTCPLYPVGSTIPASYIDIFFLFPGLSIGLNLPAGCQTGGS